jgi:hypothetical protein
MTWDIKTIGVLLFCLIVVVLGILYAVGVFESAHKPGASIPITVEEEEEEEEAVEEEVVVAEAKSSVSGFDIFFIGGQSNAVGSATEAEDPSESTDPRIFQLRIADGDDVIEEAAEPIPSMTTNADSKGFVLTLLKSHLDTLDTDRRILVVNCAYNGSAIGTEWATPAGVCVVRALAKMGVAVSAAPEGIADGATPDNRLIGMFWHQGEADAVAGTTPWTYVEHLQRLVTYFRANLPGATATTPFIPGTLNDEYVDTKREYAPFNRIYRNIQSVITHTAVADMTGLASRGDHTDPHFTTEAVRVMGTRYYAALSQATNETTVAFESNDLYVDLLLESETATDETGRCTFVRTGDYDATRWVSDADRGAVYYNKDASPYYNLTHGTDVIPMVSATDGSEGYTFSVWVKLDPASSVGQIILGGTDDTIKIMFWFTVSSPGDTSIAVGSTMNAAPTPIDFWQPNVWYHLCTSVTVQTPTQLKVQYFVDGRMYNSSVTDGQLQGSDAVETENTGNLAGSGTTMALGNWKATHDNAFLGHMSQLKVFNRPLTSNEVMQLYISTHH